MKGIVFEKRRLSVLQFHLFFSYIMQMVTFDVESQDEEYDLTLLEQQR